MDLSWFALLRAVHIAGAVLWLGGALFATFVLGPSIAATGEHGRAFMAAVQKSGRLNRHMGTGALLTLGSGVLLYAVAGYFRAPFATPSSALLSAGAFLALFAWAFAIASIGPDARRMKAAQAGIGPDGPTAEQQATLQSIQAGAMRRGRYMISAIATAFVLMVGRNIVV